MDAPISEGSSVNDLQKILFVTERLLPSFGGGARFPIVTPALFVNPEADKATLLFTVRLLLTVALSVLTVPATVATPDTPRVPVWIAEVTVVPTVKDETDIVLVVRPGTTVTGVTPFEMIGVDTKFRALTLRPVTAPLVVKLEAMTGPPTLVLLPATGVIVIPSLMERPRSIELPVSSEVILLLWTCSKPGKTGAHCEKPWIPSPAAPEALGKLSGSLTLRTTREPAGMNETLLVRKPGVVLGVAESVVRKTLEVNAPRVLNCSWVVPLTVWKILGLIPPDVRAIVKAATPVPRAAAPNPTESALAEKPPTRPPMIPPSPRSRLGDTEALKVIVDVKISLATATVVLRRPLLMVDAPTVDTETAALGAFSVEKLPIPAVIVDAWMLLKPALPGKIKFWAEIVDVIISLVFILEMNPWRAMIVLTVSGSGTPKLPVETFRVEKVAFVPLKFVPMKFVALMVVALILALMTPVETLIVEKEPFVALIFVVLIFVVAMFVVANLPV